MSGQYKLLFFFCLLCASSCVPHKKGLYFQKKRTGIDSLTINKQAYKIRAQDILSITISSLNPQTTDFFNLKSEGSNEGFKGYKVSDSGFIFIPVLDSVHVGGLTISESQQLVQRLIREHVTDATVLVHLANFNVTVLGEVGNPGLLHFEGTELTIIEALGLAKDITEFGNKKKVMLIRKDGDVAKFITLDLTKRDILTSEYFYMQPNDALYVEPLKAKNFRLNISQVSLVLGFASIVFLVFNTVTR